MLGSGAGTPVRDADPGSEFDRNWALAVMDRAMGRLAQDYEKRGAAEQYRRLSPFLAGRPDPHVYAAVAEESGTTANQVAVKRMRERFRGMVHAAVRDTVGSAEEMESELALLFAALRG